MSIDRLCSLIVATSSFLMASSVSAQCLTTESQLFTVSDTNGNARFGTTLAQYQDVVVVGAPFEDFMGVTDAGVVHVFRFDGEDWVEDAGVIVSRKPEANGRFGTAVALWDNLLLISSSKTQEVYIFEFENGAWNEWDSRIQDGQTVTGDQFGGAIAIENDLVVVGAGGVDASKGEAYVYQLDLLNEVADLECTLSDPTASDGDSFGARTAISGSDILIGAPQFAGGNTGTGRIYLYSFDGVSCQTIIDGCAAADSQGGDWFGAAVAIQGDGAVVGAPRANSSQGAAYFLDVSGSTCAELARISDTFGQAGDQFGFSVAFDGTTLVVGIPDDGNDEGSARIYETSSDSLVSRGRLVAALPNASQKTGTQVSVDGDFVWLGAPSVNGNGEAYVFDLTMVDCGCLELEITDPMIVDQPATFGVSGGMPGQPCVILYGLQPGETSFNNGVSCATFGFVINLSDIGSRVVAQGPFDSNGVFTKDLMPPSQAGGLTILFQAAEDETCPDECMSNLVVRTIVP